MAKKPMQWPRSAATGLPMGVEQLAREPVGAPMRGTGLPAGVEQRARQALSLDVGPQRPVTYQGGQLHQPLQAAAMAQAPQGPPMGGRQAPSAPLVMPAPQGFDPRSLATSLTGGGVPRGQPGEDPRGLGGGSPLGGFDPRPLSMRGGPMSYSQRGAGTTNPNAYAVGPRRSRGERLLTRHARRDPRAAAALVHMEEGRGHMAFQMWRDAEAAKTRAAERQEGRSWQVADAQEQRGFQMWRDELETRRREVERNQNRVWQLEDRDATWARADAEAAKEDSIEMRPINGGQNTAIFRNGKLFNVIGGEPGVPPTADDIAAARAMGGNVTIPLPGGGQVNFGGQPPTLELPKIYPGKQAPDGTWGPDFYYEMDPETRKPRKVLLTDGDGKPDSSSGGTKPAEKKPSGFLNSIK